MEDGQKLDNETVESLLERFHGARPPPPDATEQVPELGSAGEAPAEEGAQEYLRPRILKNVKLRVKVELGKTRLPLKEALSLSPGAVVDLGGNVGDAVEVLAGDVPIARGEVVVVEDRYCVRVTEVLPTAVEE